MQRAEELIRVATEAGLLAPDATDDILTRYRDAVGDVPNLSFLDWLFIFNVMSPDDVQALTESFERTSFECSECGTRFTGQDLDTEDEGLCCISCQSVDLQRLDTPAVDRNGGGNGARPGGNGARARDVGPVDSYDAGFQSPADPAGRERNPKAETGSMQVSGTDSEADEPTFEDFQNGLKSGTRVGRCTIVEFVARGGMGMVYKGRHLDLDRLVAVKVLLTDYTSNRTLAERFRQEARAVAAIEHPNIVQVYDYGEAGGHLYIIMQWIEGESLAQRMQRLGRVPPDQILDVGSQVCHALQAAHDAGIIHRDIKPDNILIMPDGLVKLADFGLSKNQQSDTRLSASGTYVGTPAYLAPEQLGPNVTPKADLYALACSLYHALTGRLPFGGDDAATVLQKHLTAPFPAAANLNPKVPPEVDQLLQQMAAKNPKHRPDDAAVTGEMMLDLLEELTGEAAPVRTTSRTPGTDSLGRRRGRRSSNSPETAAPAPNRPSGRQIGRTTPAQRAGAIDPPTAEIRAKVPPPPTGRVPVGRQTRPLRKKDPLDPDTGQVVTASPDGQSEPLAPANFPFRQQRKDQRDQRTGMRVEDDLLGAPAAQGRPGRAAATRHRTRATDKVTRSELQGVLENQERRQRWMPAVVAVSVLVLISVVVALAVAASGTDPYQTARELVERGEDLHTAALKSGTVDGLRDFRAELQQFRNEHPTINVDEFDELMRQLDVAFVVAGSGPEYEAAFDRLRSWTSSTGTAKEARTRLGKLRRYASNDAQHLAKIKSLTDELEALSQIGSAATNMQKALQGAQNVRDPEDALKWCRDLRAMANDHPEAVTPAFRAELNRLESMVLQAIEARIQQANGLTDPARANDVLGELESWQRANESLIVGTEAVRFGEALARLRLMVEANAEAIDLVNSARVAKTREEAQQFAARMRALQEEFPGLAARFEASLSKLESMLENTTNLPLVSGRPHGPYTLGQDEYSYVFTITTLTLTGVDVRYDGDNENVVRARLYADDDRLIQSSRYGTDPDGSAHSYVIRTLPLGTYRIVVSLDDPEGDPVRGVVVTMHQFPSTDRSATPEGAVPLRVGQVDGPVALSESRWYRFRVDQPGWVQLAAEFHDKYDVDVELYRHDPGTSVPGSLVAYSVGVSVGRENLIRWLPAGNYYLRAYLGQFADMLDTFQTGQSTIKLTRNTPQLGPLTPAGPERMDAGYSGGTLGTGSWVLPAGEYRINAEIRIPAGSSLLIRSATRLRFAPGIGLTCEGTLVVEGAAGREVEFGPQDARGRWANVLVVGPEASARIEHARFTNGDGRRYRWDNGSQFDDPINSTKGGALFFCRTARISVLDDCEIRNCHAIVGDDRSGGFGGGICTEDAILQIVDTSFIGNQADFKGGGLCADLDCIIVAIGCRFQDNESAEDGGGVNIIRRGTARFDRCAFDRNKAAVFGGGAVIGERATATFNECDFQRNTGASSGALLARDSVLVEINKTIFARNEARVGGAVVVAATIADVISCTFIENVATESGGGALFILQAHATVTGCRFAGNRGERAGAIVSNGPIDGSDEASEETRLRSTNTFSDNQPRDVYVGEE